MHSCLHSCMIIYSRRQRAQSIRFSGWGVPPAGGVPLPAAAAQWAGGAGPREFMKIIEKSALRLEEAGTGVVDDSHGYASSTDIVRSLS